MEVDKLLSEIDQTRLRVSAGLNPENKALLGQYLTPSSIADFMVSLFSSNGFQHGHVLDPGAGIGSLSAAFLNRWASGHFDFQSLELTTCEIDDSLIEYLSQTILTYEFKKPFQHQLLIGDFIQEAVNWLSFSPDKAFTVSGRWSKPCTLVQDFSCYSIPQSW